MLNPISHKPVIISRLRLVSDSCIGWEHGATKSNMKSTPLPSFPIGLVRNLARLTPITRSATKAPPPRRYSSSPQSAAQQPKNSRTVEELKQRIGRCIQFGISKEQVDRIAGPALQELARDWRELLAGSEGFLTGRDRRGLWRHQVVWGDMVGLLIWVEQRCCGDVGRAYV